MRAWRTAALVVPAFVLAPRPGVAQGEPRFDLTPRVGLYAPLSELGAVAPAGAAWVLRVERSEPALSLEFSAGAGLPSAVLGTRIVGLLTLPAGVDGFFDCRPGLACPSVLLRSKAEVVVLAGVADVVYSPLGSGRAVRPYAIAGAGIKRYRYSWPDAEVLVLAGDHAETTVAVHAGLGLEVAIGALSLRAELADFWSPEGGEVVPAAGTFLPAPRRRAQHDIGLSLGLTLLRF